MWYGAPMRLYLPDAKVVMPWNAHCSYYCQYTSRGNRKIPEGDNLATRRTYRAIKVSSVFPQQCQELQTPLNTLEVC